MKLVCSKSLRKHLKLLKQERNSLYNTVINGDRLTRNEVVEYYKHKIFVTNLLKSEKIKYFNNLLTNKK